MQTTYLVVDFDVLGEETIQNEELLALRLRKVSYVLRRPHRKVLFVA